MEMNKTTLILLLLLLAQGCSNEVTHHHVNQTNSLVENQQRQGNNGSSNEPILPVINGEVSTEESIFGENEYVEYIPGNLPLILSAAHGGQLRPSDIPQRTYGVVYEDRNTLELIMAIREAIYQQTRYRPHVVISHLHRSRLDPNREIVEAAQGNPAAELAWREFQGFIQYARNSVQQQTHSGLYIDLHGHGHPHQRLELGYLIRPNALNEDDSFVDNLAQNSSIRYLAQQSPQPFSELLRGATSLGDLFEQTGVPAIPSTRYPAPGDARYFNGGYNTVTWGSLRQGETISGIQIEHHYRGIRDSQENINKYAHKFALVIEQYMLLHFGFYTP